MVGKSIWILVITIIMYYGCDIRQDCNIKKSTVQHFFSKVLFFSSLSPLTKLFFLLHWKLRHFAFKCGGQAAESFDLPNQLFNQSINQSASHLMNQSTE